MLSHECVARAAFPSLSGDTTADFVVPRTSSHMKAACLKGGYFGGFSALSAIDQRVHK